MDFKTFVAECASLGLGEAPWGARYGRSSKECYDRFPEPVLGTRWELGGVSGGSCWDSSNPQPWWKEGPPPAFTDLDTVLLKLAPNLSFSAYRKLVALVHQHEYSENEYYGNCTDYREEWITLRELYDFLCENVPGFGG